jgi:hypothetical protein
MLSQSLSANSRDEPAQVRAVPAIDALGLALPLLCPDHLSEFVLERHLQRPSHRAPEEGSQIGAELREVTGRRRTSGDRDRPRRSRFAGETR